MEDHSHQLYNYWLYARYLAAPCVLLLFSPGPSKARPYNRRRRLAAAIVLTHITMILSSTYENHLLREIYQECLADMKVTVGGAEALRACQWKANRIKAANVDVQLFVNWIPATAYAGIWELMWRIRRRKVIKKNGGTFKGKRLGNAIILFMIFFYPFIVYVRFSIY